MQNKVNQYWDSNADGDGRLKPRVINTVFKELCSLADVEGHTPHDARHAMGRHLIENTGNIASVPGGDWGSDQGKPPPTEAWA